MNKSTKIDIILSNFQHTSLFLIKPIICRYYKPRQIKFTSPKPSTTYYTLSSLAFTISFRVLAQPDFFTLRQNYSLFPSIFFFFLLITSQLPSLCPLAFQTTLKLSTKSLRWFSFSSPEYIESLHVCLTIPKYYNLKMAIFSVGSKTVWLGFTW